MPLSEKHLDLLVNAAGPLRVFRLTSDPLEFQETGECALINVRVVVAGYECCFPQTGALYLQFTKAIYGETTGQPSVAHNRPGGSMYKLSLHKHSTIHFIISRL